MGINPEATLTQNHIHDISDVISAQPADSPRIFLTVFVSNFQRLIENFSKIGCPMARNLVAVAILAAAALQDRGVESFSAGGKFACDVQTASRGVRCTPRRSNLITPSVKM